MKSKTLQRLLGVALLLLGIISAVITNGDCTALLFIAIPAIALIISKQNYIGVDDDEKE